MKKNKNQFHCFRFIFWEIIIGLNSNPTQPSLVLNTAQVGEVTRLGGVTRLSIQSLILI